jgi:cysteine-rich repeat protein
MNPTAPGGSLRAPFLTGGIMDTRVWGNRFAALLTLLGIWGWSASADASHFRHGTIQWRIPDPLGAPLTVEFTVISSWRSSFVGTTNLNFGDGATNGVELGTTIGTGVDANGNPYSTQQYVVTHTYASAGSYAAFYDNCCRVAGLQNGANADFRVGTDIVIEPDGSNLWPPGTASPAIIQMQSGGVRTHDFLFFDPDGDAVTCRFATAAETGLPASQVIPSVPSGGAQPAITESMGACQIQWDLTSAVAGQQYVLHFVLESSSPGGVSSTAIDLIAEIVSVPIPNCPNSDTFTVSVGTPFSQAVGATNLGETLTVGVIGLPPGATLTPPAGTTGVDSVSTTLDWTPAFSDNGTTAYTVVTFTNTQDITGSCTLTINVPAVCGNGLIEQGEACDDGGTVPGDGCNADCLKENGEICADRNQCESGVCDAAENPDVCEPADSCGNSDLEGAEACDDGNPNAGDGCSDSCAVEPGWTCPAPGTPCQEICGDTLVVGGETCDDGDGDLNDACPDGATGSCQLASCGDGFLWNVDGGAEACEDGNTATGDGCDASCLKELGESCAAGAECGSGICDTLGSNTCEPANACGNGTLEPGESCEDGNVSDGDGCSSLCLREDGAGCALGAECASGQCDAGGLGCVACFDDQAGAATDSGCGGVAPYCDASGVFPFCIAACTDDGPGATDIGCSGSDNACEVSGSNPVCVDCTEATDCAFGDACNVATNTCVPGCFTNLDCVLATEPVCDTTVSTPGACVTCLNDQPGAASDQGCTNPALPVCNGASGAAGTVCVFCTDDMAGTAMDSGCSAAGMALCDTSAPDGACVECISTDDCPGLQVCTVDQACDYPDTDGDGLTDQIDVDDDGDGVPDDEEGNGTDVSVDTDGDGVPDYADPDDVACTDEGLDGVCDSLPASVDLDGDGIPNHLDLDSDGDGVPDATEGHDADGDGLADAVPAGNDDDDDGLDDAFDPDCAGMPGGCAADGLPAAVQDRDGDGAPDFLDADSDNDGLLDRVEAFDGNGDGVPEAVPSGVDVDGNGIDDAFDIGQAGIGTTGQDTDTDGRPDYLDQDSDGDGIADRVECANPTACPDTDGDGAPDALDTDADDDGVLDSTEGHDGNADGLPDFAPLGMDDDEDGLDDAYDLDMAGGVPAPLPDRDGDGTPDFRDSDDDGDGVGSAFECPDPIAGCPDGDGDGVPDYLDADESPVDTDGDGIPDSVECDGDVSSCRDTDGDGTPDHQDSDDDGDGVPTSVECTTSPELCDSDGDGLPDHRDIDSDDDGIVDSVECANGASCADSNRDGVPDYLDLDSDGDGIVDAVEGHDANMDGVADAVGIDSDTDMDGLDDAFDPDDGGVSAATQDTDADSTPDYQDPDDDADGIDTAFECADPGAGCPNGDGDGSPDYLDADTGLIDTDGDGIPDLVECPPPGDPVGDPFNCPDSDGDSMPNFNDPDDDDDGIDTADENYDGDNDPTDQDSDGDGTPDYVDTDDDGDGVPTEQECADFAAGCSDSDADGAPDYLDVCGDDIVSLIDVGSGWEECDDGNATDGDGCNSSCRRETDVPDTDGDGIPDDEECPAPGSPLQPASCPDTDGDGAPDFDDSDDDGDGIDTADESPDGDSDPRDDDTDGDGTPNYLDDDDDGDGIDTADEISASNELGNDDVDDDGGVNWLDTDADGDGIDDADEADDSDGNGVPDYLEAADDSPDYGRLILQGGRGVGCHVGAPGEGGPNGSLLLLLLGFGLGIRRYTRN